MADREQFLDIARKLNGSDFDRDNATDYAVCWQTHNCEQTSFHMAQLLAGLTQTQVREEVFGYTPCWVYNMMYNMLGAGSSCKLVLQALAFGLAVRCSPEADVQGRGELKAYQVVTASSLRVPNAARPRMAASHPAVPLLPCHLRLIDRRGPRVAG